MLSPKTHTAHQTRADDGWKHAGDEQARHNASLQARSLGSSLCTAVTRVSAHKAQLEAAHVAHLLRVHGVGVSSEHRKSSDVCGSESAALLEHGASHQVMWCESAVHRAH